MPLISSADIIKGLNKKQCEAVMTASGPLLIVAGPGSGKTRVLTHRIAYLVQEHKVSPGKIMGVTFTNKAAGEMRMRLGGLLNLNGKPGKNYFTAANPTIGTFHAIGNIILRREADALGRKSDFVIYDEDDAVSVIKKSMETLEINPKQFSPTSVKYAISAAKNELIGSKQYLSEANGFWQENVGKIYTEYQKGLDVNNAFDFDDLIGKVIELFQKHENILKEYQERFLHILVDEYQDTNFAQYTLVKMLAAQSRNICVVGDTDQGIYSWRGADIRNILAFEKDWEGAKTIFLEENYRTTQKILEAAQELISKNALRHEKNIFSSKEEGSPIYVYEAVNSDEEASFILKKASCLVAGVENKIKWSDVAILYRTNAQSRVIEEAFVRAGAPYRIIGGVRFYARAEIKDILAYLKFIQNSSDLISLARIINLPSRGIGEKGEKLIFSSLLQSKKDFFDWAQTTDLATIGLGAKAIEGLKNFRDILFKIKTDKTLTLEKAIKKLLDNIGYQKYIVNMADKEDRVENIKEFIKVARKYNDLTFDVGLGEFLVEASLFEDAGEKQNENSTTLMTLHAAKGLEFKVVFIVGLEEGILPHSRSLGDISQLEEERRLLYVGITRAKEKVYLLYSRVRSFGESLQANSPSRFLREISEHLIEKIENENKF